MSLPCEMKKIQMNCDMRDIHQHLHHVASELEYWAAGNFPIELGEIVTTEQNLSGPAHSYLNHAAMMKFYSAAF